ncbi:ASCH domain-containing protein [Vibrio palustris]|uniref:ASCH domain protein n=1 Tax=Vibrio palustris TaxID=1918946 RepID=A0A1R4B4E9_9VIBR|nr:ASCH domain-containing protein [Vibrio palustris]SJL83771.1 ASCH domain protein [Vibrio palustris]
MDERSEQYLQYYLSTLSADTAQKYQSFSAGYFCADEYNANVCADLIARGEKRASCSLEYWYSHADESRPQVGDLHVVTNWNGTPVCIVEIISVSTCLYCDVTAEFAAEEGEGDKSLEWWREAHWAFFSQECEELGIQPSQEMSLVLEHFNVVYPSTLSK